MVETPHEGAVGLPRLRLDTLHCLLDGPGVPAATPPGKHHHRRHEQPSQQGQRPQLDAHLEHLGFPGDPHPGGGEHPDHGDRPDPDRFSHAALTSGWKRYPTPWTVSMTSSPRAPSTLRSSATR